MATQSTTTFLLSDLSADDQEIQLPRNNVKFFYEVAKDEIENNNSFGSIIVLPIVFGVGLWLAIANNSLFEYAVGWIFMAAALCFGVLYMMGQFKPGGKSSFNLSRESLQLPKTGEFMWENISDIAFKAKYGKLQALFIQLSNGTIVEHEVGPYNQGSVRDFAKADIYKLRGLFYTYWQRANALELDPLEELAMDKLRQKDKLEG